MTAIYIGWSIEEINLQAASWNEDLTIRKLAMIDGVSLSEPLLIEQIFPVHDTDPHTSGNVGAMSFVVWSPMGGLFDIMVPIADHRNRPMTVVVSTGGTQ